MFCCSAVLGKFFEHGIGKVIMIVILSIVALYIITFSLAISTNNVYPVNTFIKFANERDFFLGKNEAKYKGYMRFQPYFSTCPLRSGSTLRSAAKKDTPVVKLVLDINENTKFSYGTKIELFNKDHSLITQVLLSKKEIALENRREKCSYNIAKIDFPKGHSFETTKYFRYSFFKEPTS